MSLSDLPAWAAFARFHKEHWMTSGKEVQSPPALVPEWDDGPLAAVVVLGDIPEIFDALSLLRVGLDPTAVTLYIESHIAMRERGSGYDEELKHGLLTGQITLQEIAERGGIERGEVGEAMVAQRIERDGTYRLATLPYRLVGRSVLWNDAGADTMSQDVDGRYPRMMRAAMALPTLTDDVDLNLVALREKYPIRPDLERIIRAKAVLAHLEASEKYVVAPLRPELAELDSLIDLDPVARRKSRPDPAKMRRKR